jgi:hypothetical protein
VVRPGYGLVQQLDKEYSRWLRVPRSIKTTSVKPSGTVSLLVSGREVNAVKVGTSCAIFL